MYTQHFDLEKPVFDGGIAQNDDLFLGPRQQRVAANLKIGLTTRDSVVTLTGTLGVGKTTIAAQALRITSTRLAQTWVGNTPLAPDEMLELLLAGFELAPYDMGRVQRLQTWRQHVSELSATDTRVCILVENALVLGPKGLQALEALTAADPNDCPGANLVLMGPADLHELLDATELAPLKQRIRSNQRLDPMTPEEVEQYLRHRVAYAGGDYDKIFAPDTAAMIHCFSAGVPRVINNVCETGLIVAATRKETQLSPQIVKRVAEGVYSLTPSGPLPEASVAAAPTTAPVAAEEQPSTEPMAEPAAVADSQAPVNANASVDEAQAPVDGGAAGAEPAKAEPQQPPAAAETTPAEQRTAEPPADSAPAAAAPAPEDTEVAVSDARTTVDGGAARSAEPAKAEPQQPPAAAQTALAEQRAPEQIADPAPVAETAASELQAPEPPADPKPADDFQALIDAELSVATDDAPADDASVDPQPAVSTADASSVAAEPSALPVLTDEVDFELPGDSEEVAAQAQSSAATPTPETPAQAQAAKEPEIDEQFTDDIAAATHLHEISDEMAELLFSEEQAHLSDGSAGEPAAPLDSSDLELTPERTEVVLQLDDDAEPASAEEQDGAAAQAAPTVVF